MPTVPTSSAPGFNQSVSPDAAVSPYQQASASADMFGAGLGHAAMGVGQSTERMGAVLAQHAVKLQELANDAAATQAETAAAARVDDLLFNPKTGLYAKRGADAVESWGENGEAIKKSFSDIYDQVAGSLGNDEQRRQFNQRWQRTFNYGFQSASRHVATENRIYLDATQEARAHQAIDSAALNWNNNDAFGQAILSVREAAMAQADIQGQRDPAWANQKTQEYVDKAWMARLRSMANTDAPGAQRLLEQAAQGEVRANVPGPDGQTVQITVPRLSGLAAAQLRADLYHKSTQQTADGVARQALAPFTGMTTGGHGVGDVVDRIIAPDVEGDGKNPRSTATGTGQFIDATWKDMVKRHRPDLAAGKSDDEILALRSDGALGREMTQRYAEENASRLRAAGVPVDAGSVYLAHFLGPADAVKVMKADPATPIKDVVQADSYRSNPEVMKDKTVADVIGWARDKMDGVQVRPPAPPPTQAQLVKQNANAIIERVKAVTAHDPELQQQALSSVSQMMATTIHAQALTDQANYNTITAAALPQGAGGPKSLAELRRDPRASSAYDELTRSDPAMVKHFDDIFTANAKGETVTDNAQNLNLYQQLLGLSNTDPAEFKRLMGKGIGAYAVAGKNEDGSERPALTNAQIHALLSRQDALTQPDQASKAKLNFVNQALSNANVASLLESARIGKSHDSRQYAAFVGAFESAIDAHRTATGGKDPQAQDLRQITLDLLQNVAVKGRFLDGTKPLYALGADEKNPGIRTAVSSVDAEAKPGQIAYTIPDADRAGIVQAFQKANGGRAPTEAEIQARYHARMQMKGYVN